MKYPHQYPTPIHLIADPIQIAPKVILCGDPLRAKWITEHYLSNFKLISDIRGMFYYTGYYKDMKITVGGHGMGSASLAIYVHELYDFYNVKIIIRLGTCGSFCDSLKMGDLINMTQASGENNFSQHLLNKTLPLVDASPNVIKAIDDAAKDVLIESNIQNFHSGIVHSAELFYRERLDDFSKIREFSKFICMEMECYTLAILAQAFRQMMGSILVVVAQSNNGNWTHARSIDTSLHKATLIALNALTKLN